MKRSEMVAILAKATIKHMNCNIDCCDSDDAMYSKILKELEESGMRPPTFKKDIINMHGIEKTIELGWWENET